LILVSSSMKQNSFEFSRRKFVGNSAVALGLLAGAQVAPRELRAAHPQSNSVTAQQFGAKADGKTNDARRLQEALDAAANHGTICHLPAGLYRLDEPLVVPAGVTLHGTSGGVPHSEHPIGTVLLAFAGKGKADAEPLLTLKPNAAVRNITIHYPEQSLPDVTSYPWSIRADGELCQIVDVTLTNPFQAIDLGSRWNELHLVRNVFGCPLNTGIYIDQCTDIGRI